jgi:leucyl aminopeptidase (aminopeptidase T)
MFVYKGLELISSAFKLANDVLKIKEGEEVVITADTASDMNVVNAIAESIKLLKAKPLITWYESPPNVGKAADKHIPLNTLKGVLQNADVWIEINKSWLLYSTPYEEAMKFNKKLRYICLVGMDTEMMIRNISKVNLELIYKFQQKLAEITIKSHHMKIINPSGMNIEFDNDPSRPIFTEGEISGPGEYMLFGQVDWAPIEETLNGKIVFDGSVWPPQTLGILKSPIILEVEKGIIKNINGGLEAKTYKKWLESFNDPNMFKIAHISYGCNPGAKLTGNILEDERIWGAVEWGLGFQAKSFKGSFGAAASHSDGICLNPTIIADDTILIKDGEYVHPDLRDLATKIKQDTGD